MIKKSKIIYLIVLILLISSCNETNDDLKISKFNKVNDEYYLEVAEDIVEINFNEYIECEHEYIIYYDDNLAVSSNEQKIFKLYDGENKFTIEYNDELYCLNVTRVYTSYVYIVNDFNEIVKDYKTTKELDDSIFKDLFDIPKGYYLSEEIFYSDDFIKWEKVHLDNIIFNKLNYIKPIYLPIEYSIEFSFNNESIIKNIKTDEKIIFPTIEDSEEYKFLGWYVGDELIEEDTIYSVELGNKFIAKYEKVQYNLVFDNNGDIENKIITIGEQINFPKPLSLRGYTFIGWYANNELIENNSVYKFEYGLEFTAKYKANEYKIIYQLDDNEIEQKVIFDDDYELLIPKKDGYIFLYWQYKNSEFKNGKWNYTTDIVLSPVWKKNTITLSLELYGGNCDTLVDIDEKGNIILPIPEKEGYNFVDWYYDCNFENVVENLSAESYNSELLYAYYELNNENLKFQVPFTMYNEHAKEYDEIVLFDGTISGMASKYWHKILIKKLEDKYIITNIGNNGDSLSGLGTYDYILMAYSACEKYSEFVSYDWQIGDIISFISDPSEYSNGSVYSLISVSKPDINQSIEDLKGYLEDLYSGITLVSSNIELISFYEGLVVEWTSSNNQVVSKTGIYHKPHTNCEVTLTALVSGNEVYSFTFLVEGTSEKSNALATGYIYTPYTITQNAMNTLDIIYCAFLDIDDNGDWTNLSSIKNKINSYIKDKAALAGTKIVISVNQSTNTAFGKVASDQLLREKLANNIVEVIKELGIDGVDIDWETPTSSQASTFTLLMKDIYNKVKAENPNYLVTAAIGGGMWQPPKYDLTNSIKYLDYVNLMTYSMATGNSYYQNALYKSSKGATLVSCSIDESVKIFNDLTVPNNKILVGIPFYVVVQTDAGGPGSKTGSGKSKWYSVLESTYPLSDTMKEYYDEECCVPYRYDATNKIFISFENERSIKDKCAYINALGLAGIMYWQYGQDVNDVLSNAIGKYINA